MTLNASIEFGTTVFPTPGYLRVARIGSVLFPITSASINGNNSFQYQHYALTRVSGPMQKVLHSRGTKQLSWSLSGSLFVESSPLLNLLLPSARNRVFELEIAQGTPTKQLPRALISSINVSGTAEQAVTVSLQGVCLDPPEPGPGVTFQDYKYPVPGWATGAAWVKSWSITHAINYTPNWANDQNPLPAYYRVGESEYDLRITTSAVYQRHDSISLGIGNLLIVNGVVEDETASWSGDDEETYEYSVKNVSVDSNPYTEGVELSVNANSPTNWI